MIQMVDMELDDDDKLDAVMPIPTDTPDYPYGLRICLTQDEFEKLGLDPSEAFVGGMLHGHFIARIISVNASDSDPSGPSCRVELQIQALAIESEDEENQQADAG